MRIIGGSERGRRLLSPKFKNLRPTQDQVREALFNILGESVVGAVFLDLFAGTGAVGIEALSRGSRLAIFNDNNPQAIGLLQENISRSKFTEKAKWVLADAIAFIKKAKAIPPFNQAEIIFLDPPYDYPKHDRLFRELAKMPAQKLCILEHHAKLKLEAFPSYEHCDKRIYGETALSFLRVMAIAKPSISISR